MYEPKPIKRTLALHQNEDGIWTRDTEVAPYRPVSLQVLGCTNETIIKKITLGTTPEVIIGEVLGLAFINPREIDCPTIANGVLFRVYVEGPCHSIVIDILEIR